LKTVLGVLALIAIVLLLVTVMWPRLDPARAELRDLQVDHALERERALQPLRVWTGRLFQAALAAVLLAVIVWAGSFAVAGVTSVAALRDKITIWALTTYARNALYPAPVAIHQDRTLTILPPPNAGHAQEVAALVNGAQPPPRLNGSTAKALLAPPVEEDLPALESPAALTPTEVLAADPVQNPHWALIGETGSGKSSASYLILEHLARRLPTEFVICERDGVNWNQQAQAVTPEGYARALAAIEAERQRRIARMRAADVDHISRLLEPPPYLVVVIEEADSMYAALDVTDHRLAQEYKVALRNLAQLGRKQGILLVLCMTTGTGDVFDAPTRKNLSNKLFFRSEPAVGDSWGIPRAAGLSRLPTGTAYSLQHGAAVTFPLARRPQLALSALVAPERLLLAVDAEADGLGPEDAPDGTPGTVLAEGGSTAVYAASLSLPPAVPTRVPYAIPPETSVERLTPAQRRLIIETYKRRPSLRGVERRLWPDLQHGGAKFYLVREVVQAAGLLIAEADV